VTDGPDVHVRLLTFKYTLCHDWPPKMSSKTVSRSFSSKLAQGIEPWTSTLPRWRSTAELCQRSSAPAQAIEPTPVDFYTSAI
jgi:hypothetical protein